VLGTFSTSTTSTNPKEYDFENLGKTGRFFGFFVMFSDDLTGLLGLWDMETKGERKMKIPTAATPS